MHVVNWYLKTIRNPTICGLHVPVPFKSKSKPFIMFDGGGRRRFFVGVYCIGALEEEGEAEDFVGDADGLLSPKLN